MRREIFMGITAGATSPSPAVAAIAVNPLSIETTWPAILVQGGEPPPDYWICPYCGERFDSEEEWRRHIEEEHGEEPGTTEGILKWVLIGGGILLVSALAIRPMLKEDK